MRRKDREIRDEARVDEIIKSCDCCRLGLADGDRPYIVPLNFAYERAAGKQVFYFHGAREGRKIDLIRRSRYAGFELDTNHLLNPHEQACAHSFRFQSIIGTGRVSIVTDDEEKRRGLLLIMKQLTGNDSWEFDSKMISAAAVIKLEVEEMACKEHN